MSNLPAADSLNTGHEEAAVAETTAAQPQSPPRPPRGPRVSSVPQTRPMTFKTRLLSFLIDHGVRFICATLRMRYINDEDTARVIAESGGGIFVTWHGRTLIPVNRFRNRGYWALISLSRDGDLQAENFRRFGFRIIRGSTGRRGVAATREVLAALEAGGSLAFTPDGPRGPSQKVQPGVVYFAQRSGKPIIPTGISAWPRRNLRSWDRFLIPLPFARAIWVSGDPIFVGPADDLDEAVRRVEAAINAVETEAERLVRPD